MDKPQTESQKELQRKASLHALGTLTRIVAVDMSYRDTGVCLLSTEQGSVTIHKAFSIPNPPMECSFEGLREMARLISLTVDKIIDEDKKFESNVILVEFPCFTQNAKAAISIGLVWSSMARVPCVMVEPSFIKIWSGSDAGDKKSKVKEKVMKLSSLTKDQLSNNNIVDACAIGLAFCELINN